MLRLILKIGKCCINFDNSVSKSKTDSSKTIHRILRYQNFFELSVTSGLSSV